MVPLSTSANEVSWECLSLLLAWQTVITCHLIKSILLEELVFLLWTQCTASRNMQEYVGMRLVHCVIRRRV